jgi:hypothetical protein
MAAMAATFCPKQRRISNAYPRWPGFAPESCEVFARAFHFRPQMLHIGLDHFVAGAAAGIRHIDAYTQGSVSSEWGH